MKIIHEFSIEQLKGIVILSKNNGHVLGNEIVPILSNDIV